MSDNDDKDTNQGETGEEPQGKETKGAEDQGESAEGSAEPTAEPVESAAEQTSGENVKRLEESAEPVEAEPERVNRLHQRGGKKTGAYLTTSVPHATMLQLRAETVREVCRRVAMGQSMKTIAKDADMPEVGTFLDWCSGDHEIAQAYTNALRMRSAGLAEDIVDHCETLLEDPDITAARVQALKVVINTKQWTMSKLLPKMYGDHQTIEHTGEVKLDEAQIDARLKHLISRIGGIKGV